MAEAEPISNDRRMSPAEVPSEMVAAVLNQFLTPLKDGEYYEDRLRHALAVHLPEYTQPLVAEAKRGGKELGRTIDKLAEIMRTTVVGGASDPAGVLIDLADWLVEADGMTAEEHVTVVAALKAEACSQPRAELAVVKRNWKALSERVTELGKEVAGRKAHGDRLTAELAATKAAFDRAWEMHGEICSESELAEARAAIERTRFHCAEVEEWASACMLDTPPWVADVRAALLAPESTPPVPSPVSTATEVSGGAREAQEG